MRSNKTRKKGGTLVGKGAYGCVYRPAMRCNGNTETRKHQITKFMSKYNAMDEYKKRYILKELDPRQDYFIYPIDICRPAANLTPKNRSNLDKCQISNSITHFLQIPDGGQSLFEFKYPPAYPMNFLKGLFNLCKGIELLHKHDIVHMDLKMQNAVIQQSENNIYESRWIDMGLLFSLKEFHRIPMQDKIVYGNSYFIWPFETRFLVSALNYVSHKQLNYFYENTVRRIYLSIPIPLSTYYSQDGQRRLTPRFVNEELIPFLQSIPFSERIDFLAKKTDIFSLGMVLLKITETMFGPRNPFRLLGLQMMHLHPAKRPTIEDVCDEFQRLLSLF